MIEGEVENIEENLFDLKPEAKLCILIKNMCKRGKVERDDIVDSAVELYGKSVYSSENNAKTMIKRSLEKLEKSGYITLFYDHGETFICLDKLETINAVGVIKLGDVISSKALGFLLIFSTVAFFCSLLTYKIEYVVITAIYMIVSIGVYASYNESFVFK